MTKKVIQVRKERYRVLKPEVPAVTEKYETLEPLTVYDCDFCSRGSRDALPVCIGCGKHSCYFCLDKVMVDRWYQVGTEADTSSDYMSQWTDESEDFRFGDFRICDECLKSPPARLSKLMELIGIVNRAQSMLDDATRNVIDEIEKLEKTEK